MNEGTSDLCILPLSRIKRVMKSSSEVGNITNEACFVMSKATEGFVALLLRRALKASSNKMQVDYPDLANVVSNNDSMEFLVDFIPPKIKGREYLEILKRVEEHERRIALEDEDL
ncbi:hypothetical protein AVEN_273204-1 [Araneus ventricosus]|uniref:Transcription factor CBF/NF-Y/archaeal histone domain-containing protein n=1 Tax=Araneus ventricosus TaxID=182803 RepID=A0A4Y2GUG3_ARAVE|nr:hypothetical protein AVEN_273204-1 [Araneus ventricosus]